jgi:hypothetical protein
MDKLSDDLRQKAHQNFVYDRGELYNRHTRNSTSIKGNRAGWFNTQDGYHHVYLDGKSRFEHRIIFLMHYGYMPESIDHVNGVRDDNRIVNLRACTCAENQHNATLRKDNTSGVKGVYWDKKNCKWRAQIKYKGKLHFLGRFDDIELAELVVMEARDVLHGEFANNG